MTDGAALLDRVDGFLARYVAYPSEHARVAHALWIAHTFRMDAWESTPRIAFLSPEPGSGKTRALEVTELLVPRPVLAVNTTPAYLFRKVADPAGLPTILYDEVDTLFGPKAKENEDVRGMLNAGHRKGAVAGRCVVRGRTVDTEELEAYCAVALAGLDDLPDTLMSRSVVIRMRRRSPEEPVEPFRRRECEAEAADLRTQLAAWATAFPVGAWPEMPDGIADRDADVWESLLVVADVAGGSWPERARVSSVTHVTLAKTASPSLGVRLLADLRTVFGDREHMLTQEILDALAGMEDAPWGDLRGKPLDARGLSRRLAKYGVERHTVRVGPITGKGYSRADLADPWSRYVTQLISEPTGGLVHSSRGKAESLLGTGEPLGEAAKESVTWVTRSQPNGHLSAWEDDTPGPQEDELPIDLLTGGYAG
ncbi:MAG TPA: DUF3631 domain-containing protein [Candidatus Saccharimonadales bacterium]|nr:DUF3631 domain-containing protein [Candidatus Saccharimonadales bacterium]